MQSSEAESGHGTPDRRRPSRNVPRWAVFLGVLAAIGLLVRALLPIAVERGIERSVSDAVRGALELDDVDLSLLRGGVSLEGLRFGETADSGEVARDAAVKVKGVHARIDWLDLFDRRVRVQELEIEAPHLVLERMPDSGLDLVGLLAPVSAAREQEDPRAEEAGSGPESDTAGWSFVLDQAVLEAGRVRLVDLTVEGPGRWRAKLSELRIERLALEPGIYDDPTRISLDGQLEDAPVLFSAELSREEKRLALQGELQIEGLPLRNVELYLESAEWSRLRARLDTDLHFEGDSEGHATLRGSAALREVGIDVPEAEAAALRIGALEVEVEQLVLEDRRASIDSLVLRDAELLAEAGLPPSFPLLGGAGLGDTAVAGTEDEKRAGKTAETMAETEDPGEPMPSASGSEAPTDGEAPLLPPRWQIDVAHAELRESRIRVGEDGIEVVIESARLDGLESGPDAETPGDVVAQGALRRGEAKHGSFEGKGQLALGPTSFEGELTWTELDVPTLLAALATPVGLESLRSAGSLEITVRAAPDEPRLGVSGEIDFADLSTGTESGDQRCLGAFDSLAIEIERLGLATAEEDEPGRLEIHLGRVEVEAPRLELARTDQGFSCQIPAASGGASAGARPDAGAKEDRGSGIEPRVRIDRVTTRRGALLLSDRTISPFVETRLDSLEATLEGLASAPLAIQHYEVLASGLGSEPLEVSGSYEEGRLETELALERVGLAVYNPYLTRHASFAVERGELSARLDLMAERGRGYEGDLRLVLHDARVTALSPEGFRESFGVSLSLAMAMLRNLEGDIVIDAPFSYVGDDGFALGVGSLVRGTLRRALLNAIATPLKLVGAVVAQDGGIEEFSVKPIFFESGQTTLSNRALEQVTQLAEILGERPWLAVRLEPRVVRDEGPSGLAAAGAPAANGKEASPRPGPELAAARAQTIADRLQERFGVDPARVRVAAAPDQIEPGLPRVGVSLVPAGDPLDPEKPTPERVTSGLSSRRPGQRGS